MGAQSTDDLRFEFDAPGKMRASVTISGLFFMTWSTYSALLQKLAEQDGPNAEADQSGTSAGEAVASPSKEVLDATLHAMRAVGMEPGQAGDQKTLSSLAAAITGPRGDDLVKLTSGYLALRDTLSKLKDKSDETERLIFSEGSSLDDHPELGPFWQFAFVVVLPPTERAAYKICDQIMGVGWMARFLISRIIKLIDHQPTPVVMGRLRRHLERMT